MQKHKVSQSDFTRDRKFGFKDLILNLISFTRPGIQTELDRFFKAVSKHNCITRSISKSAFTQSRRKVKAELFKVLNSSILDFHSSNAPMRSTWKNKRVVAIDGSLLNLPHSQDIEEKFGGGYNQYEQIVSARCSFAFDVCNELVLDAAIDKRKSCEKELALRHLEILNPVSDILVFDRGYPAHWLVGVLMKRNFKFCFRLSTSWKDAYNRLNESGNDIDWTMTHISRDGKDKLRELDIPSQIHGLRLVSIDLDSGEKEVLLTNLTDRVDYNFDDLKQLYHLRWGVEESYKIFKKVLNIENFSGKTVLSIYQDFYARIVMLNISSIIRKQGFKEVKTTKNKIQINKTQAIAKTKDFFIDIFYKNDIKNSISLLLLLLKDRTDIIRPFRSFPRNNKSTRRRVKMMIYKGI